MLFFYTVVFAMLAFVVDSEKLQVRQTCGETYEPCAPAGAGNLTLPPVGPGLRNFYSDLIEAISPEGSTKFEGSADTNAAPQGFGSSAFCCALTSQCLVLRTYDTPFCWDRFTTNFYFPDGSYGSIVTGNYTSASGTQVNLIYGDWKNTDGVTGNIYSGVSSMMPDTSTLPMPTPWTSSGVGSAIPASELGANATMPPFTIGTATTTISAITLESTTITIGTSECGHCNGTIYPGITGLPPMETMTITGPEFSITTVTVNGTGGTAVPSASSSITFTFIFPPITNSGVVPPIAISLRTAWILTVNIVVWTLHY